MKMEFGVLSAVVMKSSTFWDITPFNEIHSVMSQKMVPFCLHNVGFLLNINADDCPMDFSALIFKVLDPNTINMYPF
jgi:hypothetical protein